MPLEFPFVTCALEYVTSSAFEETSDSTRTATRGRCNCVSMNRELKPNEPGEPLNSNEREGEAERPWFFRIVFQLDDPRTMFLRLFGLATRSGQMDGDVRFICESGRLILRNLLVEDYSVSRDNKRT
jgi:hypothetical protein